MTFPEPPWLTSFAREASRPLPTLIDRMRLAIRLAGMNVEHRTGGPFGAAVFEVPSGRLLGVGVNLVVRSGLSVAHAEVVALSRAQERRGTYDLGLKGLPDCELVTSCEPCLMCQGAVLWSGVRRLVCAARGGDAERIGFEEGPKRRDWVRQFRARGIDVVRDICRAEAARVLNDYRNGGGEIYNSRGSHHHSRTRLPPAERRT